jgi:alpha-ketoglutarate-dependent taurine dioxygenase
VVSFLDLIDSTRFSVVPSTDGRVSTVRERPSAGDDHSHQSGYFGLHTDGLALPQVPSYGILYCVNPGTGSAPTVLADSRELIDRIQEADLFALLSQVDAVYFDRGGAEYTRPFFETHPATGQAIVNNIGSEDPTRSILRARPGSTILPEQVAALQAEVARLSASLIMPHSWTEGDFLIFDNRTFLHGRGLSEQQTTESDAARELLRMWIS